MWVVMTRAPRADAPTWPGRRMLAAIDAIIWPVSWVVLLRHVPAPTGLVGPVVDAVAALSAIMRLQRALWLNHRYWFTTWRWGKVVAALLLIGCVIKLTMGA